MEIKCSPVVSSLIFGHSFVQRLNEDLRKGFNTCTRCDFDLKDKTSVKLFGVGGRTVDKLRE